MTKGFLQHVLHRQFLKKATVARGWQITGDARRLVAAFSACLPTVGLSGRCGRAVQVNLRNLLRSDTPAYVCDMMKVAVASSTEASTSTRSATQPGADMGVSIRLGCERLSHVRMLHLPSPPLLWSRDISCYQRKNGGIFSCGAGGNLTHRGDPTGHSWQGYDTFSKAANGRGQLSLCTPGHVSRRNRFSNLRLSPQMLPALPGKVSGLYTMPQAPSEKVPKVTRA